MYQHYQRMQGKLIYKVLFLQVGLPHYSLIGKAVVELIPAVEAALVTVTAAINILCKGSKSFVFGASRGRLCCLFCVLCSVLCLLLVVFCVPECDSLLYLRVEMENSMA
ncbi:hypothetical protein ACB092_07G141000 [Castanea dentata]